MTHRDLYERLCRFADAAGAFAAPLFNRPQTTDLADQLMRAANSAASNYRAANLGRSNAEFRSKLGVAHEEIDEARHWLERIQPFTPGDQRLPKLYDESVELSKILSASRRTAEKNAAAKAEDKKRKRRRRRPID